VSCTAFVDLSDSFFFLTDTSTTQIYTLSLHDALPILRCPFDSRNFTAASSPFHPSLLCSAISLLVEIPHNRRKNTNLDANYFVRSEEHTSELQSRENLVCRLLLEKKKKRTKTRTIM